MHLRTSRATALIAALVVSGVAAVTAPLASAAVRSGPSGSTVVLDSRASYLGVDAAATSDGTTYVAWISVHRSDDRFNEVHLCVLPRKATSCRGGVQTTGAVDPVSAQDLHVVARGSQVTLVWHHRTEASSTTSTGDRIAVSTVRAGVLQAATDVAVAPSNSTLASVVAGPRGISAVVVSGADDDFHTLYHYPILTAAPVAVRAPYSVGTVQLADDGDRSVLVVGQYAADKKPLSVAWKSSSATRWSGFTKIAGTWTDHDSARLLVTSRGIRLLATGHKNGLARTVVASWQAGRHRFGKPVLALPGQRCVAGGRDVVSDASGRMSSVSIGCDTLTVGNHQLAGVAATTSFRGGLTAIGQDAQIATTPSGRGWVVWLKSSSSEGGTLVARPITLPALITTVRKKTAAGVVRVTVPLSCLPAGTAEIGLAARASNGWRVRATTLRLGKKKVVRTLRGSSLRAKHTYVLRAKVTFVKKGDRAKARTVTKAVRFTTCAKP